MFHAARSKVLHVGHKPKHGEVIAEISWILRFVSSKRYLTALWIPTLQHVFPYGDKDVWSRQNQDSLLLRNTNYIRNRITHLEPVFKRDAQHDNVDAGVPSWISPDAAAWFDYTLDLEKLEIGNILLCGTFSSE